jgi:putative heme-binding domain-containing protein
MLLRASVPIALLICAAAPLGAQQHSYSQEDIENGARLYRAHCSGCHGEGDAVDGIDLRRGEFRRVASDDDLTQIISKGVPGTAMPPTNLSNVQVFGLVAYIRSLREMQSRAATGGDPQRGQALFEGRGGCLSCHRVAGKGSRIGPDLTDVGLIRPASHLERSLVAPNETILPQHSSIRAVTREGAAITGRRLNEDTHTLLLLDSQERLISLSKAQLREYSTITTSPMPSFEGKLSKQELADIVSYLISLKGPGKR